MYREDCQCSGFVHDSGQSLVLALKKKKKIYVSVVFPIKGFTKEPQGVIVNLLTILGTKVFVWQQKKKNKIK